MKIGINLPGNPDPAGMRKDIATFINAGFKHIEFNIGGAPLMIEGAIEHRWLDLLRQMFSEFDVSYSAHIGPGLDCRNTTNYELHRTVLLQSVRIAAALGMDPLVIHFEEESGSQAIEERFYDAHLAAADLAGELGTTLCIENIEVEHVQPVISFIQKMDHPAMRMTYDVGHAFLASRYFGFDYLESLKASLPYLGHLHLTDNSGTFEELRITDRPTYDKMSMSYRYAYGRGDIHLPPLWGMLPYNDIASIVRGFSGTAVCEFYSGYYKPFLADVHTSVDVLFNPTETSTSETGSH